MHYLANVTVRFKKSVLEPQGQAILLSLHETGHNGIDNVRVGKFIELTIEAADKDEAHKKAAQISEELLYNPVMEVCDIEITEPAG